MFLSAKRASTALLSGGTVHKAKQASTALGASKKVSSAASKKQKTNSKTLSSQQKIKFLASMNDFPKKNCNEIISMMSQIICANQYVSASNFFYNQRRKDSKDKNNPSGVQQSETLVLPGVVDQNSGRGVSEKCFFCCNGGLTLDKLDIMLDQVYKHDPNLLARTTQVKDVVLFSQLESTNNYNTMQRNYTEQLYNMQVKQDEFGKIASQQLNVWSGYVKGLQPLDYQNVNKDIDDWLADLKAKGRGDKTVKRVKHTLQSFVAYLFKGKDESFLGVTFRPKDFTPQNLFDWVNYGDGCQSTRIRNSSECTRFAKMKLGMSDFKERRLLTQINLDVLAMSPESDQKLAGSVQRHLLQSDDLIKKVYLHCISVIQQLGCRPCESLLFFTKGTVVKRKKVSHFCLDADATKTHVPYDWPLPDNALWKAMLAARNLFIETGFPSQINYDGLRYVFTRCAADAGIPAEQSLKYIRRRLATQRCLANLMGSVMTNPGGRDPSNLHNSPKVAWRKYTQKSSLCFTMSQDELDKAHNMAYVGSGEVEEEFMDEWEKTDTAAAKRQNTAAANKEDYDYEGQSINKSVSFAVQNGSAPSPNAGISILKKSKAIKKVQSSDKGAKLSMGPVSQRTTARHRDKVIPAYRPTTRGQPCDKRSPRID